MSKYPTVDVISIDEEHDTWGGSGTVIRIPDNVMDKFKDDWDNGYVKDIAQDRSTSLLDVEQLINLFDFCKKLKIKSRRLRQLLRRAEFQVGVPIPVGDARPALNTKGVRHGK